jgi:YgiT-type zinc finger domain-containing protein
MICSVCSEEMITNGAATQIYRHGYLTITVSGIPAVAICPRCHNAVLEWEVAQEVEELVQPIVQWSKTHQLPTPTIAIMFPEQVLAAQPD